MINNFNFKTINHSFGISFGKITKKNKVKFIFQLKSIIFVYVYDYSLFRCKVVFSARFLISIQGRVREFLIAYAFLDMQFRQLLSSCLGFL